MAAVIAALRGTPHLSHHAPVVEVIRSSPDGTDAEVTVEHDPLRAVDAAAVSGG
jgi:uncharacterized protein (DUF2249 family)